MEEYAKISGDT